MQKCRPIGPKKPIQRQHGLKFGNQAAPPSRHRQFEVLDAMIGEAPGTAIPRTYDSGTKSSPLRLQCQFQAMRQEEPGVIDQEEKGSPHADTRLARQEGQSSTR